MANLAAGITWERLPAERDARIGDPAAAGGCCCCCCCCLHTVGGLIAAATTRPPRPLSDLDGPVAVVGADEALPRFSITQLYWRTLVLLCLFSAPLFLFVIGERVSWASSFWYVVLLLPALQLGTSLLLLVWMMLQRRQRFGHAERMRHLGRITLRAFIGGVIGVGVMLVVGITI